MANEPNVLEYAEIWTTALDQQAEQIATSGWMEANASQVQYIGGKKVRVPTLLTTGLGDYTRGTGAANRGKYAAGAVDLSYTDYELEMDRSAEFAFDRHDVDESGFIIQAPAVMGNFQQYNVVPEIDAFRYSKIASLVMGLGAAGTAYQEEALTKDTILDAFLDQIRAKQNVTGMDTAGLIAIMPYSVWAILEKAAKAVNTLVAQDFQQGGLSFQVNSINGISIIPIVENRMKTAYEFYDGTTQMGFAPATGAQTINWIITPRSLPIAISKTDNLKVFSPDQNQSGDDWLIQYRKYHDLWIMKNQLPQIILSVQPA